MKIPRKVKQWNREVREIYRKVDKLFTEIDAEQPNQSKSRAALDLLLHEVSVRRGIPAARLHAILPQVIDNFLELEKNEPSDNTFDAVFVFFYLDIHRELGILTPTLAEKILAHYEHDQHEDV